MSGNKCPICRRGFLASQKIVRVVVEAVSRGEDDGPDHRLWSKVHEWDALVEVHLDCAVRAIEEEIPFEYAEEIALLPDIEDMVGDPSSPLPRFKLVQGGKG